MTAKSRHWLTVAIVLMVASGLAYVFRDRLWQYFRRTQRPPEAPAPLKVAVAPVQTRTLARKVAVTGEIRPMSVVDVVPKVTGRLERLRLPDGTAIDEGTVIQPDPETGRLPVIAIIEHAGLQAALQQAEAAVKVATAARDCAKVMLADSLRDRQQVLALFEKGAATENERDKAVTAYERCAAELRLAEAQVAQAEAAVRQAQVTLAEATIVAPIPGLVIRKHLDEGNMVGPGTPLLRIGDTKTVQVLGGISERYLAELVPGKTPADISVDAYPDKTFTGLLRRVPEAVDPQTRTGEVEVHIPNPDGTLKPGMFARVSLTLQQRLDVPVVPDGALLRQGGQAYVYVVNNATAHRRPVVLGLSEGDFHEVQAGLKPGELVVVRGQRQLQDGQTVQAVREDEP